MKGFVCFLLCLATVFGLFTGCVRQVEPTQPVTTTEETTLAPTTEPTVETTVFVPLPLELDTPAEEPITTAEEAMTIQGYIDPECTVTV